MLLPGAIFKLKIHQNAFAARALPRTPLGSLQSSPDPVDGFTGGRFTAGEGTGGGKGKGRGAFHHFFFYSLTTDCRVLQSLALECIVLVQLTFTTNQPTSGPRTVTVELQCAGCFPHIFAIPPSFSHILTHIFRSRQTQVATLHPLHRA